MRRFAALVVACLAVAASSGIAARDGRGVPFRGAGVSFTHPAEWKVRLAGYLDIYLRRYLIVALSTEHLHRPVQQCVQELDHTTRCGPDAPILDTLPAAGVYISWWEDGSGFDRNQKLTGVPGAVTHLAGRLAKIVIDPSTGNAMGPGYCPKGTTGSVSVVVAAGQALRGMRFMVACANTSDFSGFFRRLLPMLRSTSVRD